VRADGGIAPLVRLLNSWDLKVQRAAAGALRTLAFKNDDNKRQIVECGALPLLIQVCAWAHVFHAYGCMLQGGCVLAAIGSAASSEPEVQLFTERDCGNGTVRQVSSSRPERGHCCHAAVSASFMGCMALNS
jgi:hypothetical protein